jgi:RNA polymerase sigma-70 factor (ECF subfamily)
MDRPAAGHSKGEVFAVSAQVHVARAGEVSALSPLTFDAVYDQGAAFVWRLLRGFGVSEAGVEDAVQDVFIVVHRRLGELEDARAARAWLAQIARRVAHDHRRTRMRKGGHEPLPEGLRDPAPGPGDHAERREAVALLQAILEALSEESRAVLVMADIVDMTVPEIAEALGLNVNTTYTRLRRARESFHAEIARRQEVPR